MIPAEGRFPPARYPSGGVFVGRTEELQRLRTGIEDALLGQGRLAVLAGEPGIGKTRTAEELSAYARSRGFSVFVGRCHEGEGVPAFWPWVQVLRALLREGEPDAVERHLGPGTAEIAQIIPELRSRVPASPVASSVDFESNRFRLFDSVMTFLRNASAASPLLLLLEDLHWADKPTLLLLQFVAREMAASPLYVLGTYRDVEVEHGHPLAESLPSLRREAGFQRVLLRGLGEGEVKTLLKAVAGQEVPEAFARAIASRSEGNPFFIGEILRSLVEEGILYRDGDRWRSRVSPDELRVPESVCEVVGRRLARLSESCRQVLGVASVIGRDFDAPRLEAVSEVDGARLLEALEEAVAANVVAEVPRAIDRYTFAHALIRETLYQELRGAQRIRLHHRVATVLESSLAEGEDALLSEVAHHALEAAGGGRDVEKAIDYAGRAAERAHARLAYEEAVGFYERALALLEPKMGNERRRGELLLALGDARYRAGDGKGLKAAFELAAESGKKLGDPALLAAAALGYAGPFGAVGIFDGRGVSLLEDALTALGSGHPTLRAQLLARLGAEYHDSGVEQEKGAALQRQATELARESGDVVILARVLRTEWSTNVTTPDRSRFTPADLRRVAIEANDPELACAAELHEVVVALEGDDVGAFDAAMVGFGRVASEARIRRWLGEVEAHAAMRALLEGKFDEAESRATRAFEMGGSTNAIAEQVFWAQMFRLRTEQGRLAEIEPMVSAMVDQYPLVPAWRAMLARLHMELGGGADVRDHFEIVARNEFSAVPRFVAWMATMQNLAEIAAYLGDGERASVLLRILEPFAGQNVVIGAGYVWCGPVKAQLGLLATTLGRFTEAEAHFQSAIAISESFRAKPFVAQIRCDYAGMLSLRDGPGDREQALSLVDQSLELAGRLGMKRLSEKVAALKVKMQGIEHDATPRRSVFLREGHYWTVRRGGGEVVRLKDMRGLHLIHHLLCHPGVEFRALELSAVVAGTGDGDAPMTFPLRKGELAAAGMTPGNLGDAGEILDARAKAQYRSRLLDLQEELEEARRYNDAGRVERLQEEIEIITRELSAAFGLGGRGRRAGSVAERARVAVTKAIRSAIAAIAKEDAELGRELREAVRTGSTLCYRPAGDSSLGRIGPRQGERPDDG